jgi:hypothetical protein
MEEKPKQTTGDVGHALAKGALAGVPFVGGLASEIFNIVIAPPLTRRRDYWMNSIAEGLTKLEEKMEGFKIEELSKNEMFITTVMQASQTAIRNHQKEKLEALRNAVLNAALPNAPEEDLQLIFLNFVDTLTTWHMRILKLFDNPKAWFAQNKKKFPNLEFGGLSNVLLEAYPELRDQRGFFDQLFRDLYAQGLINTESMHVTMTASGLIASRTTAMGKVFIGFITSPIEE